MENKEAEKPVDALKEPEKPIDAQRKEAEKAIENKESLKPPASRYTEDAIEAVESIPIDVIDKKVLIVMYKEKAYESRELQGKMSVLNATNSDLSRKLGVAQERLSQITGVGVVFTVLIAIAGVMAGYVSYLPDSPTKTILFRLAIGTFVVCVGYHLWNAIRQKNIE